MEITMTKADRIIAEMMILEIVDKGSYTIKNKKEHAIAEQLVEAGAVTVLKKKNYGHIEKIA